MRGCRARFTSRQVYWFDTWAGRLAILHSLLSAYLMSNLLRFDYGGFAISMGFTATVAIVGVLVMLFVAKARVSKSERYARYGSRLAAAYVLFSVGVMAVSGTYVLGMAVVSVVFFAGSVIVLVLARRAVGELQGSGPDP